MEAIEAKLVVGRLVHSNHAIYGLGLAIRLRMESRAHVETHASKTKKL
jgi:hypothetical protein